MESQRTLLDVADVATLNDLAKSNPWISQLDRWNSDTWRLDGLTPGYRPFSIYWTGVPPHLLGDFKLVAASMFINVRGEPDAKYSSAPMFGVGARFLARFMAARSISSFADLDRATFNEFLRHLGRTLDDPSDDAEAFRDDEEPVADDADEDEAADGEAADAGDDLGDEDDDHVDGNPGDPDGPDSADGDGVPPAEGRGRKADRLTYAIAVNRLNVWKNIHDQRRRLAAWERPCMPMDPFADTSVVKLAQSKAKRAASKVTALPPEVAIPIMREAYRLLGRPAEDVIRLQRAWLAHRDHSHRIDTERAAAAQRKVITGFRFGTVEGETAAWHDPIVLAGRQNAGAAELKDLVELIRDAAIATLLSGIGWRISEACSVEVAERADARALPSCVTIEPSETQTSDHFMVHGLVSKHRARPEPEKWLMGARLTGTRREPPTVRAVRVLERLLAPWRGMAAGQPAGTRLCVAFRQNPGLPRNGASVLPISAEHMRKSMRRFIRTRVDLETKLAPLVAANPELRRYQSTGGGFIRPHQWRHTYYQMLMAIDPELQPALSEHFKHTSMAMTENAYGSKGRSDRELLDKAFTRRTVQFFKERRDGTAKPLGQLDRRIRDNGEELQKLIADFPLEGEDERIEAFCKTHDLRLWPAEHGNCMIALSPHKARCHLRQGRIDWRADRPNVAARSPSVCIGCANFSIDREHGGYWHRRYVENRTAWIGSGRLPAFRVAFERARQAEAVLRALKLPIPIIPPNNSSEGEAA